MSHSVNQLINDGGDCRTAPATPGLLIKKTATPLWHEVTCDPPFICLRFHRISLHVSKLFVFMDKSNWLKLNPSFYFPALYHVPRGSLLKFWPQFMLVYCWYKTYELGPWKQVLSYFKYLQLTVNNSLWRPLKTALDNTALYCWGKHSILIQ